MTVVGSYPICCSWCWLLGMDGSVEGIKEKVHVTPFQGLYNMSPKWARKRFLWLLLDWLMFCAFHWPSSTAERSKVVCWELLCRFSAAGSHVHVGQLVFNTTMHVDVWDTKLEHTELLFPTAGYSAFSDFLVFMFPALPSLCLVSAYGCYFWQQTLCSGVRKYRVR